MGEKLLGEIVFPTQFWLHYLSENNLISEDARIPEFKLTINSGYLQTLLVTVLWNYHWGFSSQSASSNDRNSRQVRFLQPSYQTLENTLYNL